MFPQRAEDNGSGDFVAGFANAGQDRCEAMQLAYRVSFGSVGIGETVDGDPGAEGVHQDDAVLTVGERVGVWWFFGSEFQLTFFLLKCDFQFLQFNSSLVGFAGLKSCHKVSTLEFFSKVVRFDRLEVVLLISV